MRIGVISDTHGNLNCLDKAVKKMGHIDRLIHLGDDYNDAIKANKVYNLPLEYVTGNNDYDNSPTYYKTLIINNARILITHGHIYRVNYDLGSLYYKAQEENASLVLYGHTHKQNIEWVGNILFVNPGSPTYPRDRQHGAAVLNIDEFGGVDIDMFSISI